MNAIFRSYAVTSTTPEKLPANCFLHQDTGMIHCIQGQQEGIGGTLAAAQFDLHNKLKPSSKNSLSPKKFVTSTKQDSHGGNNFVSTNTVNGKTIVTTNHPKSTKITSNHPVTVIKRDDSGGANSVNPINALKGIGQAAENGLIGVGKAVTQAGEDDVKKISNVLGIHSTSVIHQSMHQAPKAAKTKKPSPLGSTHAVPSPHSTVDPSLKAFAHKVLDNQGHVVDLDAPSSHSPTGAVIPPPIHHTNINSVTSPPPPPPKAVTHSPITDVNDEHTHPQDNSSPLGGNNMLIIGGVALAGLVILLIASR